MAAAADIKATAAERAAEKGDAAAEIKALRVRERAEELASTEANRIVLAGTKRPLQAQLQARGRGLEPLE